MLVFLIEVLFLRFTLLFSSLVPYFKSCELFVVAVGLSSALVFIITLLDETYSLKMILLGLFVLDSELIKLPNFAFCLSLTDLTAYSVV